ncbi:MAG: hypothetical protein LUI85_02475 [Bacteroides sp.]|nr:hypothetical protein [Bacteroides sp.]
MADLFEDASNKSVSAIQSIIDKYEMLIKYMSGSDKDITIDELKDIGFTDKDIEKIEKGEISIKDLTDAIKRLKNELKGKSPWQSFVSSLTKGIDAIKKAGGDSKKVGQGITDIGNAITSFSPALKEFGADIANIFGIDDSNIQSAIDGISGLGQTASGIGQIMSGDIVGGVMSAVSGVSQVVNAMGSLFGPDGTAYYEKIKEQLEAINSVYDRIIDKSKENITFGGGFTSIDAASTALDNYEKKLLNLQKIADASGRAGASWNRHSAEWHSNKNVGSDNFAQMSEIIGKSIKSMDDLYYLSGDELYLLMSQMPEAWSAIDSRIRENLESIVDCKDEANELKDALNEAITGVSYDSFYSGFIDQLSNMETSYEDMCDNFEEYLRKSMMAGLVAGQYKDQIRKLYDSWVAAGSDQNYTKEEIQELRNARDELLQSMITERDNMAEIFGWESSSSISRSSTSRGFGTEMTHEDAGELSGRFTALQIAGEEIKNQNIKQTDLLSSINEKISLMDLTNENIPQLVANVPDFTGQTKEIATNSYQPQVNVIFPDVKIDVLTAEVSTLKGIVDEMRTFQIEKFTDVAEGVIKISKNTPVMNNKLDSINNNIKKAL